MVRSERKDLLHNHRDTARLVKAATADNAGNLVVNLARGENARILKKIPDWAGRIGARRITARWPQEQGHQRVVTERVLSAKWNDAVRPPASSFRRIEDSHPVIG